MISKKFLFEDLQYEWKDIKFVMEVFFKNVSPDDLEEEDFKEIYDLLGDLYLALARHLDEELLKPLLPDPSE